MERSLPVCSPEKNLMQRRSPPLSKSFCKATHPPAQIAGFLVALRGRGKTSSELSAILDVVLAHGVGVPPNESQRSLAIDVVNRFRRILGRRVDDGCNSRCRCRRSVCKHGNRSASSSCGTTDVLEELGVNIGAIRHRGSMCFAGSDSLCTNISSRLSFAGPPDRVGIPTAFNLSAQWPTRVECSGR